MIELKITLIKFIAVHPLWSFFTGWFIFSAFLALYYLSKEGIINIFSKIKTKKEQEFTKKRKHKVNYY